MNRKLVVIIILFTIGSKRIYCQDFSGFKKVEGLNSNVVYNIYQDSKGYLWACTEEGVSKYDGYKFTHFTIDDGLTDNDVYQIKEDNKGRIWFLTNNGKPCIYDHGNMLNASNTDWLKPIQPKKFAMYFLQDRKNSIWYATLDTAYHIENDIITQKLTVPSACRVVNNIQAIDIYKDTVFLVHNCGVYNTVSHQNKVFDTAKIIVNANKSVLVNGNDFFYLTNTNLFYFSLTNNTNSNIFTLPYQEAFLVFIQTNHPDTVLITATNHIYKLNIKTHQLVESVISNAPSSVTDIYKDIEGNTWVSSLTKGLLMKENDNNDRLIKIVAPELPATLGCKSLNKQDGTIYLGYDEGYYATIRNRKTEINRLNKIRLSSKIVQIFKAGQYVFSVLSDLVIAKKGNEEIEFNLAAKAIELSGDYFYIATSYGINKTKKILASNNKQFVFGGVFSQITQQRATRLLAATTDSLWAGGILGLQLFVKDKPIINLPWKTEITKGYITKIIKTADNHIAFATNNMGLAIINQDTIYTINKQNGLLSNTCNSIYAANNGVLWIATSKGINKLSYNIALNKSIIYHIENYNHINNNSNNVINDILQSNDTLFIATSNGAYYHLLSNASKLTYIPKVYIESVVINDSSYHTPIPAQLSYNENRFRINFIGLAFQAKGKILYQYKLEGIDTSWQLTENSFVEYPFLSPQHYKFIVIAAMINGNWNATPAVIEFTIQKPWWERWWFVIPAFFIALLLLFFIIRYFVNDLRNKHRLAQQKLELDRQVAMLEQKALRLQMNPHFIFNTINAIKGAYGAGNNSNAQKYIEHFSLLMRQILQTSDDALVKLENEIEMLTNYLELNKLRTGNKFDYCIQTTKDIDAIKTQIPIMLIQPFVENALLHGIAALTYPGFISIRFSKADNQYLKCVIEDNGIGRERANAMQASKLHTSKGIHITMERIQLIAKNSTTDSLIIIEDLKDDKGNAGGTKVTINIPNFES